MVVPESLLSSYAFDQALAVANVLTVYVYTRDNRFEPIGPRDPVRN